MKPTAAHRKLLQLAEEGDSMFGAVQRMEMSEATTQRLFYELIDANMIEYNARDEPMQLTALGKAALKGRVVRRPKPIKKATPEGGLS